MNALCAKKYNGYTLNSKRIVDTTQKIKVLLAIVLTILLTVSALNAMTVNAASFIETRVENGDLIYSITQGTNTYDFPENDCHNKIFGRFALSLVYVSYGGLFDVLEDSDIFSIQGVEELSNDDVGEGIWSLFGALYNSVAAAGIGLALMWTLMNIIEKMSEGRLTEELVISLFAKLLLAAFIIIYGKDLCASLLGLGNSIFDAFKDAVGTWTDNQTLNNSLAVQEAKDKMDAIIGGNVFACLGYIIQSLVPGFAMLACWVLACVQLISRILELGIRTAFMPIGVADFMTHGTHSPGMRYLKAYAGCACQGAAMYVILIAGVTLMNSGNILGTFDPNAHSSSVLENAATGVGYVVLSIVIAITMLGLMKRVDNLLREVFS